MSPQEHKSFQIAHSTHKKRTNVSSNLKRHIEDNRSQD